MMEKETRLEVYRLLTGCCQNLWNWKLDEGLQVLSSDCPHEALYKELLFGGFWQEQVHHYMQSGRNPILCVIEPGLCWILAFDEAQYIYAKGPFFNRSMASDNYALLCRGVKLSQEARGVLETSLAGLPFLSGSVTRQFTHMLHFCLWGEKTDEQEIRYIRQELPHKRYRGDVATDLFEKNSGGWEIEQQLLDKVRRGDTDVAEILSRANILGNGVYHSEKGSLAAYRQNTMVLLTLISRAAVEGGLSQKVSFALCTEYRKKAEECRDQQSMQALNHDMVLDYVERVRRAQQIPGSSAAIRQCCQWLDTHPEEKLRLSDLAVKAGYTETHLSRKFKQEMGCSIVEYMQKVKIQRAMYFLENTKLSIDEISTTLNFNTRSYFTKIFRQHTGMSPSEYRKGHSLI